MESQIRYFDFPQPGTGTPPPFPTPSGEVSSPNGSKGQPLRFFFMSSPHFELKKEVKFLSIAKLLIFMNLITVKVEFFYYRLHSLFQLLNEGSIT